MIKSGTVDYEGSGTLAEERRPEPSAADAALLVR